MAKTPQTFYADFVGKRFNSGKGWNDSYFGYQCVAGFKAFCEWMGIPVILTPNNYADGYWFCKNPNGTVNKATKEWQEKYFYKVSNPKDFKNGCWVMWSRGSSHSGSHIAMWYNGKEFGQNQGGNGSFCLKSTNFSDACGALIPKQWADLNDSRDDLSKYSDEELANRVLAGYYGNGNDRLVALGSRYKAVQALVDKIIKEGRYAPTLPFTQSDTNSIVNKHRYDFDYATFKDYMQKSGGYNKYVKSLGGVFTKWADRNTTVNPNYTAKTVKEFQEAADYVFGMMTMYGFNYNHGEKGTAKNWGYGADDAFYTKSADYDKLGLLVYENGHKTTIDQICSGNTKGGMQTNCGWSATYIFHKAGLIPADGENLEVEFYGDKDYHKYYRKKGAQILTPKDTSALQVGDVIGFFGSGSGFTYKHCAVVVDVNTSKKTYTLFDGGSARFIKTRGCNVVGKLGDSPLYGSYVSWKVLRLKLNLKDESKTNTTTNKPKVLFIGNSYTYKPNDSTNLPAAFKSVCKNNGVDIDTVMIAEGGWTFEKHWNNSTTITALKSKKYKYVIMQGQSQEVGCMDGKMTSNAKTYAKKLADLAKSYGAKVYFLSQQDYYFKKWDDGSKTYYRMKYQDAVDSNYRVLGYPVIYGGAEVKKKANGDFAPYFASDGYHPTAKAQQIVANEAWATMKNELKPSQQTTKYVHATGVASYFDKAKAGTYEVVATDGLHIRNDGVQSAKSLAVLPYKTKFTTYGYYDKDSQGRIWLYGVAKVGNTEYTGFCCSKTYLKKV